MMLTIDDSLFVPNCPLTPTAKIRLPILTDNRDDDDDDDDVLFRLRALAQKARDEAYQQIR